MARDHKFFAYTLHKNIKVHQFNVKSAYLNGMLNEDVYLQQPPGFGNSKFPGQYYKLEKVVYGLNQAPRAWLETLTMILINSVFKFEIIDPTLFIRSNEKYLILIQIYVDNILFGSIYQVMVDDFVSP